jgi:proteasome activator subunit 4
VNKTLTLFGTVVDCFQRRIVFMADKYTNVLLDNANTGYAEMRAHIAQNISVIIAALWQPWHPSVAAFVRACSETEDPLRLREGRYMDRIRHITAQFPVWKEERLPPPRTSQSEVNHGLCPLMLRWLISGQYDKVGLTLLQCIWIAAHGQQATLMFPHAITMLWVLPFWDKRSSIDGSSIQAGDPSHVGTE